MVEFRCEEGKVDFGIKGNISEIAADMCIFVRNIREVIKEQSDEETVKIFDTFLKDYFIDMSLGDPEKMFFDAVVDRVADRVAEKMKMKKDKKNGEE